MTATEEVVVKKKLKIKFATKRIGSEPGQTVSLIDEWGHSVSQEHNGYSKINTQHKFVIRSSNEKTEVVKSSIIGVNKRGPPGLLESQKKRMKMDRSTTQQCSNILKKLMAQRTSWAFKEPVDPVKLGIPDYFSIISEPMDLGTVKSRLEKNTYSGAEQFAADVRLTFSNAMLYNPPSNDFHNMAKELCNMFNSMYKPLEVKCNMGTSKFEQENVISRDKKPNGTLMNIHKGPLAPTYLSSMNLVRSPEKQKMKRAEQVQKKMEDCGQKVVKINFNKGTNNGDRHVSGSADLKPLSGPVASQCRSCSNLSCQCRVENDTNHTSSSDLSSSKSFCKDDTPNCGNASRRDVANNSPIPQRSKLNQNSDGALRALDDENMCPSSHIKTPASTATSREGLQTHVCEVQLSPKRALRAAMLKSRFADTILKAQQKTLLDHGDKADPIKMQQEKERLEREQREEKARIEAEIRAAEAASRMRAEAELRAQREKEREAARIALQKMEKTVEIDENFGILHDIEMLSGSSAFDCIIDGKLGFRADSFEGHSGNPLEQLGLFMKDDYNYKCGDEDEEVNLIDGEEGEILR